MRTYYRSTAHEPASRPTLESVRQVAAHRGLCLAGRFSPEKVTTSRPTRTSSPSLRGEGFPLWRVVNTIPVPIVVFLFTIEQVPEKKEDPRELGFFSPYPCRDWIFRILMCRLATCLGWQLSKSPPHKQLRHDADVARMA
jgi:hypothetical protein